MTFVRSTLAHRQLPTAVALIAVLLVAIPLGGSPGLQATAITVGIYAAVAVPLGLIYGHAGILSVAQAAFAAMGAYAAAILAIKTTISPYIALVIAMAIPMAVAALLARPIVRLRPLAVMLATLAFGSIVEAVIAGGGDFTGGRIGLTGIYPLPGIGTGVTSYFVIWFAVVVIMAGYVNLAHQSRGRALNSVRVDEMLARSVGVNVASELTIVFTLAAGVAGAAGWFYVYYIGFVAPESLSFGFSVAVFLMVIVGGRKAVLGPVIGAILYTKLRDILPAGEVQDLIFGLLLAVILVVLPNGVASLPQALRERFWGGGSGRTIGVIRRPAPRRKEREAA